jgi:hypothetical protein
LTNARGRELALIREFVRRAHHYLSGLPERQNWLEWLALMQHHGAPTRLVDWTYSLHVATHFALSHAVRRDSGDLVVWMIDTEWCLTASAEVCRASDKPVLFLQQRPISTDTEEGASLELLAPERLRGVWPISPFRLNERLTLQKGVFLAPGDPTQAFVDNLLALPDHDKQSNLVRFTIPRSEIGQIGRELDDTNVTEATLFPGIDGFARSLWMSARYLRTDSVTSLYRI